MTPRAALRVVELVNSTEYGGVEEHVRELSNGLVRRGDSVTIVCPPTPAADRFASSASAEGLDVERQQVAGGQGRGGTWSSLASLHRMLRTLQPDVLHVHLTGYTGGRLAVVAGRRAGVGAIVCTAHLAPAGPVPLNVRAGRALLNRGVHRFLAVSEDSLGRQVKYLGQPRSRSMAVANGVDMTRFPAGVDRARARKELDLPLDVPIVGTVGRLAPQKSIKTLVHALPTILAARPDVHALIVGDGPLRDELRDHASRLGVADRLHMVGFRIDIPMWLAAMDLFVLTSVYEGLPISILEAMATGLPVIATAVDGVPEAVVEGVTGHLVPPAQPTRLAEAVIRLLSDPDRAQAMGAAGRERVLLRFTISRFIDSVRAEYELALGAADRRLLGPDPSHTTAIKTLRNS